MTPTPPDVATDGLIAYQRSRLGALKPYQREKLFGLGPHELEAILNRLAASEARVKELEAEVAYLEEQLSEAGAAIQREGKYAYEAGNQDGYKEGFKDAEREYRRD